MSIEIIDDFYPQHLFDTLSASLLNFDVPWFYCSTAYDEVTDLFGYSYHHTILVDGKPNSTLCSLVEPMVTTAIYRAGDSLDKLVRIRVGMVTVTHKTIFHKPHVDFDYPHKTGLIYINEADGETVLYKNQYVPESKMTPQKFMESIKDNFEIEQTILPKPNRLVLFDGLQYHNSTTPTTVPRRIVVNFNYTVKA